MGFIDIHSHILPGFDDGPENIEQCIEAGRRYRAIGVDRVIATPHWIPATKWRPSPRRIVAAVKETEQALNDAGVSLTILPGMEISGPEKLDGNFILPSMLPLGQSDYYLVEFPFTSALKKTFQYIPDTSADTGRLNIIAAHPERCALFQDNGVNLSRAVDLGMLVQVNIDSILGGFGKKARETALSCLRLELVHFLATDSHARGRRLPPDVDQWQRLEALLGRDAVQTACADNPGRLLAGKPVRPIRLSAAKLEKFSIEHFTKKTINIVSPIDTERWGKRFTKVFRKKNRP